MPKPRRIEETAVTYDPLIVPPMPIVSPHEMKSYSDSCVDDFSAVEDGPAYDGDDNPADDADMARFDLEEIIDRVRFLRDGMHRDPCLSVHAVHAHAAHCYLTAAHAALQRIFDVTTPHYGE